MPSFLINRCVQGSRSSYSLLLCSKKQRRVAGACDSSLAPRFFSTSECASLSSCTCPFSSRLTDKAVKDYAAYRSSLLFWALVDLIYNMFKVRKPSGMAAFSRGKPVWDGLGGQITPVSSLWPAAAPLQLLKALPSLGIHTAFVPSKPTPVRPCAPELAAQFIIGHSQQWRHLMVRDGSLYKVGAFSQLKHGYPFALGDSEVNVWGESAQSLVATCRFR